MKIYFFHLCLLFFVFSHAQETTDRFQKIKEELDELSLLEPDYALPLKTAVDLSQLSIADFLQSVAELHQLNITIDSSLKNKFIVAQLSRVSVKEVLLYLCKHYQLDLSISGTIVHVFSYQAVKEPPPPPKVFFDVATKKISLDLKQHPLNEVFQLITKLSPYSLLYPPAIGNLPLQFYVEDLSFNSALNQLAFLHQLQLDEVEEGIFLFQPKDASRRIKASVSNKEGPFTVLSDRKHLRFHAKNYPIHELIKALVDSLEVDWFQAQPLEEMGEISLSIEAIQLDDVLPLLFDNQYMAESKTTNAAEVFSYRKKGKQYFFGKKSSLSARKAVKINLQHRSVELLDAPYRETTNVGQVNNPIGNFGIGQSYRNSFSSQTLNSPNQTPNLTNRSPNRSNVITPNSSATAAVKLPSLIPAALLEGLEVQTDKELNALLVLGEAQAVNRLEKFIKKIDQPVPVILIEVMLIEVNKSAQLDTGIAWGIGEEPTTDQGNLFPDLSTNIGASTANRILGGYQQLRALNLGQLQPNFFLQLRALEESGTVKVLSSPKMATLNGHRAVFSNSEISYYAYTAQNFYGFQNPQTSEITNYIPISAGLTLSVQPYVTGDQGITLDIFVQQSSFNNVRIAEDAPPGIESREFSSIVRMRNKDIAILGGLEQNSKNNSGRGIPFLARIPILKWLFSQKTFNSSKRKLTVLIQPTIIQ